MVLQVAQVQKNRPLRQQPALRMWMKVWRGKVANAARSARRLLARKIVLLGMVMLLLLLLHRMLKVLWILASR